MAVRERILDPVAEAVVCWRTADEGGRQSGPPTAPVYTATSVFVLGGDSDLQPDWPWTADPKLSIWVERVAVRDDGCWLCKIDFPVRDLAVPYIVAEGEFLIMEGPTIAAHARFTVIHLHR